MTVAEKPTTESVGAALGAAQTQAASVQAFIINCSPAAITEESARSVFQSICKLHSDITEIAWPHECFQPAQEFHVPLALTWGRSAVLAKQVDFCLAQASSFLGGQQWSAAVVAAYCGLGAELERIAQLHEALRIVTASEEAKRQARSRSLIVLPDGIRLN